MAKARWGKQCTAHNKRGERCKCWAIIGGEVCRTHGGSAPQVRAAATRRFEQQKINAEVAELGIPIETDPHDALLGLVWEWAGVVHFLRRKVQALQQGWVGRVYSDVPPTVDADGITQTDDDELSEPGTGIVGPNHLGDAAPHVYVVMYGEACDKLAKYSKLAIDAGIAERNVRLAEQQGELIAQVIRGVLAELQVPGTPETFAVVRKHLELAAPAA